MTSPKRWQKNNPATRRYRVRLRLATGLGLGWRASLGQMPYTHPYRLSSLPQPPKVKGCSKPRSRRSVISSTSSPPRQNVTRTQLMLHAQDRFLQVEISGVMPELVVDLLEIVEVDIPEDDTSLQVQLLPAGGVLLLSTASFLSFWKIVWILPIGLPAHRPNG